MTIFWVPIVNPAAVDPRRLEPVVPAAHSPSVSAPSGQPQPVQPQAAQPQAGTEASQARAAQSPSDQDATAVRSSPPQPSPPQPSPPQSGPAGGREPDAPVQAASAAPGGGSGSVEELLRQLFAYLQAHAATHPVLEPAIPALGVAVRAYGLHIPALALNQAVAVYHVLQEARAQDPTLPAP